MKSASSNASSWFPAKYFCFKTYMRLCTRKHTEHSILSIIVKHNPSVPNRINLKVTY